MISANSCRFRSMLRVIGLLLILVTTALDFCGPRPRM